MTQISFVKPSYNELKQKVAELEREIEGFKEEINEIGELEYHKNALKNKIEKRTRKLAEKNTAHMHNLKVRVKEFRCLYEISKLIESYGISSDEILKGVAELIPQAWQYSEITCARIIIWEKNSLHGNLKHLIL